jgi:hypothetical protein
MTWLHVLVFIQSACIVGLIAWCYSLSDDLDGLRDEVDRVGRQYEAVAEAHNELHTYVGNLAVDSADDTGGRHRHSGSSRWAA